MENKSKFNKSLEQSETGTSESNLCIDLSNIINRNETKKKAKVYYLDVKLINRISKIAKKEKISDSKLVNDILKHVLSVK